MNTKIMSGIQLINAIIWAAIILISSYALKGIDNYRLVFYILIVGAGLQISLMGYISDRLFTKKNCIRQHVLKELNS